MTRRRTYHATAPAPGEIVSRRRIPTRAQTVRSDFVVPALSGLFVGACIGVVFGKAFEPLFGNFGTPFLIFMATFAVVGFIWRAAGIDRMVWASEDVRKMPGEPEPQQPPALPMPAIREPILLNGQTARDISAREQRNADRMAFERFVYDCYYDTTIRRWRGEPNYAKWRDVLIAGSHARWKDDDNHNLGWELSRDPDAIIAALSGQGPNSPTSGRVFG